MTRLGDIEGPVRMIDVYVEAGLALERLPTTEQYKVIRALCCQAGIEPPKMPRSDSPKAER